MRENPRLEADNFVALILHAAKGDDGDGGGQICRPTAVTRSDASQSRVRVESESLTSIECLRDEQMDGHTCQTRASHSPSFHSSNFYFVREHFPVTPPP